MGSLPGISFGGIQGPRSFSSTNNRDDSSSTIRPATGGSSNMSISTSATSFYANPIEESTISIDLDFTLTRPPAPPAPSAFSPPGHRRNNTPPTALTSTLESGPSSPTSQSNKLAAPPTRTRAATLGNTGGEGERSGARNLNAVSGASGMGHSASLSFGGMGAKPAPSRGKSSADIAAAAAAAARPGLKVGPYFCVMGTVVLIESSLACDWTDAPFSPQLLPASKRRPSLRSC
ncbi:hypothetical protein BT69DRAFT_541541 [Atractiella rhizophila]|nr:hypothetical protein BT69DRAFT_541541 [Atractiella rhizophila]